jgi:hypothetical protein
VFGASDRRLISNICRQSALCAMRTAADDADHR